MQSQEAAAKNKRNSGSDVSDVSAKVLAMYAGTRTSPMEPQWLVAGEKPPGQERRLTICPG